MQDSVKTTIAPRRQQAGGFLDHLLPAYPRSPESVGDLLLVDHRQIGAAPVTGGAVEAAQEDPPERALRVAVLNSETVFCAVQASQ